MYLWCFFAVFLCVICDVVIIHFNPHFGSNHFYILTSIPRLSPSKISPMHLNLYGLLFCLLFFKKEHQQNPHDIGALFKLHPRVVQGTHPWQKR